MRKVFAGLFSSLDGVVQAHEWQPTFDAELGEALLIATYRPVR